MDKNFISANIKYLREKSGLNQSDFGGLFDCTRDNIASYERGSEPKLDTIYKIVNYFHITIDDFYKKDLSKSDVKVYKDSINTNSSVEVISEPGFKYNEKKMCSNCEDKQQNIDTLKELVTVLKQRIKDLEEKLVKQELVSNEQKRKVS